jgi:fatty-acyl-CoA synthase
VRVFGGALSISGPISGPARQDRLRAAARVLESSVPAARRLGVAIGVETHDDFSASSVVAELLAMADPEWIGAVWDSHHPHRVGEAPADVYANLGRRILLAQVKDARRGDDGGWQLVLLGQGEVPVRQMLRLLAAGGYQNWVSVEWEKRWHPEIEAPEVALRQYRSVLATWMEVTP